MADNNMDGVEIPVEIESTSNMGESNGLHGDVRSHQEEHSPMAAAEQHGGGAQAVVTEGVYPFSVGRNNGVGQIFGARSRKRARCIRSPTPQSQEDANNWAHTFVFPPKGQNTFDLNRSAPVSGNNENRDSHAGGSEMEMPNLGGCGSNEAENAGNPRVSAGAAPVSGIASAVNDSGGNSRRLETAETIRVGSKIGFQLNDSQDQMDAIIYGEGEQPVVQ
ncbi:hypothetical protein Hanom_Chr10g00890601 [Helianthus anomalus]